MILGPHPNQGRAGGELDDTAHVTEGARRTCFPSEISAQEQAAMRLDRLDEIAAERPE